MPERTELPGAPSCECERNELRMRRIRGGGIQYVHQCLDCGNAVGSAVPHGKVAVRPPDWNEDLQALHEERWRQWRSRRQQESDQGHAGRVEAYRRYLLTPEWRARRDLVLQRDHHLCQGCLRNRATEVHHTTYEHVGRELLFELVALCGECHAIAHADA